MIAFVHREKSHRLVSNPIRRDPPHASRSFPVLRFKYTASTYCARVLGQLRQRYRQAIRVFKKYFHRISI